MNKKLPVIVTALIFTAALAGAARAEETSSIVEKCSKNFGSIAVAEPQDGWGHMRHYGLGSPSALLRLMIQQSGCFDVVERGVAMQNLQQERALGQSGDLRQESNVGKGQMQAADFVLTPNVQVGASDTGGIGGLVGGRLGIFGVIAGGLKFKEASTSILVADVRSSIQVAAAEGKATKTDFGIGGWGYGAGGFGGGGGYTKTPEGKMIAASLLDNYNKVVLAIRDQDKLIKTRSASSDVNAAGSTRAEAPQEAGQMLQAKIANVKLYAEPSKDSKVVTTLRRSEELVATGESRNGFAKVDAASFSGWVQRTLVMPGSGSARLAPQSAAPLVQPISAQVGIYGTFDGQFSGSEQGSFVISVGNGMLSGSGSSQLIGQFGMQGNIDPRGGFAMLATGATGTAVFTGRINGATGVLAGTWRYDGRRGGGSFHGQRQ